MDLVAFGGGGRAVWGRLFLKDGHKGPAACRALSTRSLLGVVWGHQDLAQSGWQLVWDDGHWAPERVFQGPALQPSNMGGIFDSLRGPAWPSTTPDSLELSELLQAQWQAVSGITSPSLCPHPQQDSCLAWRQPVTLPPG